MVQFIIRGLEEEVKIRLKRRAERHGRTLEEEIIQILREVAKDSGPPKSSLGSRIAARFSAIGLVADIPELRGQAPRPVAFKSCESEE
jgi:plasmid stability protein